MKRVVLCSVAALLLVASPSMALTFFEDFSDAVGSTPNPAEWDATPGYGGFNAVSGSSAYGNPAPGLIINNNYGSTLHGVTHEFGQTLTASATDDVHYDYDFKAGAGSHRNKGDWIVELSMGDVHAPAFGTVLGSPIPVIAYAKPNNGSTSVSFFDGTQWLNAGYVDAGGVWYNASVDIHNNGTADISVGAYGPYNTAITYNGGFDRVSILYPGGQTAGSYWYAVDNINVTGVPEPATLALLGLGGLALLRRRRA